MSGYQSRITKSIKIVEGKYSNPRDIYLTIESSPPPIANERTPLLGRSGGREQSSTPSLPKRCNLNAATPYLVEHPKAKYCDCRLWGIGFLLIGGFSIASYLLIVDTRFPVVSFTLDLVNREIWSKISVPLGNILNATDLLHVLILHTGGHECHESENCIDLLRKMQETQRLQKNTELPYNFLIGGDGQTYEIRGWQYESGLQILPKQSSFVIGFIGNYTFKSPSAIQLKSALSLISESQRKQKLKQSFEIYGVRNLTMSHRDGEALFDHVSKWNQFHTLLKVI